MASWTTCCRLRGSRTVEADQPPSQHVALLFAGWWVQPGTRVTVRSDHYALLRSIQEILGLRCLAQSCGAKPIAELLGP